MPHPLLKLPPQGSRTTYTGKKYSTAGARCVLDVRVPNNNWSQCPLVVAVPGGGWSSGTRTSMGDAANYLTDRGFAVALVDYRFTIGSGAARWPAQIQDVNQAARWLLARASTYRLWTGGHFVWGASAGAHLALHAGMLPVEPESEPSPRFTVGTDRHIPSRPLAVQADYPPTDLPAWCADTTIPWNGQLVADQTTAWLLGGSPTSQPALAAEASPITHAAPDVAPIHCWHGTSDQLVPLSQSQALVDAATAAGGQAQLQTVAGMGHGDATKWTRTVMNAVAARFEARLPTV